jgi:SpoVK/Ycf46/Vps4 family AAA+-type ATPase
LKQTSLRQAIEWPRLKRDAFEKLGLTPPRGILLHGPPGCSKTTLARAAAGASGVAFLSLNPAQVYASSYMGEAESVIRKAFTLARAAAPCILFFDEVDSIFGEGDKARGSSAEARVLSTFLNEMDGVDRKVSDTGVLVLGATNRPWTLDAALLRPGRMGDKIVYVPPPDRKAREQILQMQFPDQVDFDFETLAGSLSEGMTGAEIIGACQSAKQRLLRDLLVSTTDVQKEIEDQASMKQDYLEEALKAVKPLLSNPQALKEFRIFENKCQR